jgi:hypothetical protein
MPTPEASVSRINCPLDMGYARIGASHKAFDDIILYSSNLDDHFEKLDEVLSRLKRAGLKLKPSKCEFIKDEVVYLGHVVCRNGIKPNPKIIDSVENWKEKAILGNKCRLVTIFWSNFELPISRL